MDVRMIEDGIKILLIILQKNEENDITPRLYLGVDNF